jgi:choline dehydrogenase-like flavoprotein
MCALDADYVIVGAGSAGAAVANRLSSEPATRVITLEAGPARTAKFARIPAAFVKLFHSELDWDYLTEPQKGLDGREIYWPRGRMLGGSSAMNAMMWVRGFAADYDEWGERASQDWDFAHVEKYLTRIENGPLVISRQRSPRSWTTAWLTATQHCGYRAEAPNTAAPEGFCETRVTQRRGARWSTADGYLKPAKRRPNLTVLTNAAATRVLINQKRATGVEFTHRGRQQVVHARREVVLCGGAINSPQLLMLSGIGDRDHLASHGIDVVQHSADVGRNLVDHLVVPLGFAVDHDTLFAAKNPLQLIDYLLRRRGMLTSNVGEAYGFVRSRPDLELPDLELIFAPAPFFDEGIGSPPERHGIAFGPILLKPRSHGTISLRSAEPTDKPIIDPRYLSDDAGEDRATLLQGLRICAEIADSPTLRDRIGPIVRPRNAQNLSDATLEDALATCSQTLYHPVGTCRMGNDEASVVDPKLRVRGIDALRVADASVMPTIIRGHTHAPSVLIGEKAAELILS